MTEYQYNVEVKSRFALFLDDSLSNEDPDLLLSKLQKKREKSKKEKIQGNQQPNVSKSEELPKPEAKVEPTAAKVVQPSVQKSPRTNAPIEMENGSDSVAKADGNSAGHPMRGRGSFRPPSRGFRGGRGQGPRGFAPEIPDVTDEAGDQRDTHYESRGRGRGRGRGTFTRDRGSHFGDRKFDNFSEEKTGRRPHGERDDRDAQVMSADDKVDGDDHPVGGDTHDGNEPIENGEEHASMEEEPKIYTLAEYKAMKKLTKPTIVLNTQASRQANDGKDVFANMVVIHKAREVPDNTVKVEESEPQEQPVNTSFPDGYNNRGRGRAFREFSSRGDRGGFSRGPRGRGGGRGRGRGGFRDNRDRENDGPTPVHHMPPPSLDNDVEFPSLT